jgi:hypothetical protein
MLEWSLLLDGNGLTIGNMKLMKILIMKGSNIQMIFLKENIPDIIKLFTMLFGEENGIAIVSKWINKSKFLDLLLQECLPNQEFRQRPHIRNNE